jgi:hypothetical protein
MPGESQPFYSLQVNMQGCIYDIRVNDGPVYRNAKGFPLVVEFPINRWLHNGDNEFSLRLRPMPGQSALGKEAKCTAIVYVRENGADRDTRKEVARLEYPATRAVRQANGEDILIAQAPASFPFQAPRWLTAATIADTPETLAGLLRKLEEFRSLLAVRNMDGVLVVVRDRDEEDALASYQTFAEQQAGSRREYQLVFDENEYVLQPLRTKDAQLRLYGNGRLARLEIGNGQSPLYYLTADRKSAAYITLLFMRGISGEWVVIR